MALLNICIPVFNYDVNNLVFEIYRQCVLSEIKFRILVFEDGSKKSMTDINSGLIESCKIIHIVSKKNVGRSAARNILAENSDNGQIIFIDCDSAIPDKSYINRYLQNKDKKVVCGGTIYLPEQKTKDGSLRYKYGIKREMKTAAHRNHNSNAAFTTNNFMISKDIFNTVTFREFLKDYGHEDSLFGYELKKNNYTIFHIDNPVVHEGIEANNVFLTKTLAGLNNLVLIEKSGLADSEFTKDIKIVHTYIKIKKIGLHIFLFGFYSIFKNILEKHLLNSLNPKLSLFDLYKIGYYCKIKRN